MKHTPKTIFTLAFISIGVFSMTQVKGEEAPEPEQVIPEKVTPEKITPERVTPEKVTPERITPERIEVSEVGENIDTFETDEHIIYSMQAEILFDFDKSELRADALNSLQQIADSIEKRHPDKAVAVHGHTDSKGSENYNDTLSGERAAAVAKSLRDRTTVTADDIQEVSHGEEDPVVSNTRDDGSDDPKGRQKNRRVEIWVKK